MYPFLFVSARRGAPKPAPNPHRRLPSCFQAPLRGADARPAGAAPRIRMRRLGCRATPSGHSSEGPQGGSEGPRCTWTRPWSICLDESGFLTYQGGVFHGFSAMRSVKVGVSPSLVPVVPVVGVFRPSGVMNDKNDHVIYVACF